MGERKPGEPAESGGSGGGIAGVRGGVWCAQFKLKPGESSRAGERGCNPLVAMGLRNALPKRGEEGMTTCGKGGGRGAG